MPADDAESRDYQNHPQRQGHGADDQSADIDEEKMVPGLLCSHAHGGAEGVHVPLHLTAPVGHVSVRHGVSLLGLAVGAGADQGDQGVLKLLIVLRESAAGLQLLRKGGSRVFLQEPVQGRLLLLNLPNQPDHSSMVRRHDVAERQAVNVHHGPADLLQPRLTGHVLIHDYAGVGIDIVDAEHRQQVGQQRHQAQQDDGQNQALLQGQLSLHAISSEMMSVSGIRRFVSVP